MFSCKHLNKSYGGVVALANVELTFPNTGITAIVGPNGAGKTTLMNVMSGYQRADSGDCSFDGRVVSRLPPYKIAKLGVARSFQDLKLIREVSALENVLLARPNQRGESLLWALSRIGLNAAEQCNEAIARDILRFAGLEQKHSDLVAELSYGQQKVLALACCVASEARALLLDEPVAGIDGPTIARILDRLRELRAGGKLIVLIEHDMDAVRSVADNVIVMDAGAVVATGSPAEVFASQAVQEVLLG